ncbi:hypothetical protein ACFQS7_04420 [Dankookia sp. GCM10030260]
MVPAFKRRRHQWEDAAAVVLVIGYIGGFLAAMEFALARLVFLSSF